MNKDTKGLHLMIDATCRTSESIEDKGLLEFVLNRIVGIAGMKSLLPAHMIEVELDPDKTSGDTDDGGITGVGVLSTSHISIHTWPLTKRFSFDLYSCRTFDSERVFKYLDGILGILDAKVTVVERQTPELETGIVWKRY